MTSLKGILLRRFSMSCLARVGNIPFLALEFFLDVYPPGNFCQRVPAGSIQQQPFDLPYDTVSCQHYYHICHPLPPTNRLIEDYDNWCPLFILLGQGSEIVNACDNCMNDITLHGHKSEHNTWNTCATILHNPCALWA